MRWLDAPTLLSLGSEISLRPILGQEPLQRHRISLLRRLARRDACKARGFLEPCPLRRKSPRPVAHIGKIPAHGFVLEVHHLVVRVEHFDAVPIRIAEISEQSMARPMPARPELKISAEAETARDIASRDDMRRIRHSERRVMKPRADAAREHDVVRISLALQKD